MHHRQGRNSNEIRRYYVGRNNARIMLLNTPRVLPRRMLMAVR